MISICAPSGHSTKHTCLPLFGGSSSRIRTPFFWSLDLHADYRLPFMSRSSAKQITVGLDVFNLFGRHGVMEVDQDYIYEGMPGIGAWEVPSNLDAYGNPKYNPSLPSSTFYKTPTLYQTPRSLQIGIRFTY